MISFLWFLFRLFPLSRSLFSMSYVRFGREPHRPSLSLFPVSLWLLDLQPSPSLSLPFEVSLVKPLI
jgi:hypothetical protein